MRNKRSIQGCEQFLSLALLTFLPQLLIGCGSDSTFSQFSSLDLGGTQFPGPACQDGEFSFTPNDTQTNASVGNVSSTASLQVNTTTYCSWIVALSQNDFNMVTINSSLTGTGNGSISYVLQENQASLSRTAQFQLLSDSLQNVRPERQYTLTQNAQPSTEKPCIPGAKSSSNLAFGPDGGTIDYGITISGDNCIWYTQTDSDWLSALLDSTSTPTSIAIGATQNTGTARSGTIALYATQDSNPPTAPWPLQVTQQASATCSAAVPTTGTVISPYSPNAQVGTAITILTGNNCNWTVSGQSTDNTMFVPSPTLGANGAITWHVSANPSSLTRSGTIQIFTNGTPVPWSISLSQQGGSALCSVTIQQSLFFNVSSSGDFNESTPVTVSGANCNWSIQNSSSDQNSWMDNESITPTQTLDAKPVQGTVAFNVEANSSNSSRTGTIQIMAQQGSGPPSFIAPITITQDPMPTSSPSPTVSPAATPTPSSTPSSNPPVPCVATVNGQTSFQIPAKADNGSVLVTLTGSNCGTWTAVESSGNIFDSPGSVSLYRMKSVRWKSSDNPSFNSRMAQVTVAPSSNSSGNPLVLTFIQQGSVCISQNFSPSIYQFLYNDTNAQAGTVQLSGNSICNWSAGAQDSWVNPPVLDSSGNLKVSVQPNSDQNSRTSYVNIFSNGNLTGQAQVNQDGAPSSPPCSVLLPQGVNATYSASQTSGSIPVTLLGTNCNWTLTDSSQWWMTKFIFDSNLQNVTNPPSYSQDVNILLTFLTNLSSAQRNDTINILSNGTLVQSLNVTQEVLGCTAATAQGTSANATIGASDTTAQFQINFSGVDCTWKQAFADDASKAMLNLTGPKVPFTVQDNTPQPTAISYKVKQNSSTSTRVGSVTWADTVTGFNLPLTITQGPAGPTPGGVCPSPVPSPLPPLVVDTTDSGPNVGFQLSNYHCTNSGGGKLGYPFGLGDSNMFAIPVVKSLRSTGTTVSRKIAVDLATFLAGDGVFMSAIVKNQTQTKSVPLVNSCTISTSSVGGPIIPSRPCGSQIIQLGGIFVPAGTVALVFNFSQVTSRTYLQVRGLSDFNLNGVCPSDSSGNCLAGSFSTVDNPLPKQSPQPRWITQVNTEACPCVTKAAFDFNQNISFGAYDQGCEDQLQATP